MEKFIISFGNSITGALGISNEAMGLIMVIGLIWFYIFKWKPLASSLSSHVLDESDASGNYTQRAADRDKVAKQLQSSIDKINVLLDVQSATIHKVDNGLAATEKERNKMIQDVENIKMELIKISIQLSMSPNARNLA